MMIPFDFNPLGLMKIVGPQPTPMPTSGLVFYMPMTSMSDYETTDSDNIVSKAGNVSFTTLGGIDCASFSSTDDYIYITDPNNAYPVNIPSGSNTIALSMWVKLNNPGPSQDRTYFSMGGNKAGNALVVLSRSVWGDITTIDTYNYGLTNIIDGVGSASYISDDDWHHFYMTCYNSGGIIHNTTYLDGEYCYTANANVSKNTATSSSPRINGCGFQSVWNKSMNAHVAAFRIYDRMLEAEEIQLLSHEFSPLVIPVFYSQSLRFDNDEGAVAKQLVFNSKGRAYSFTITAGTLPSGVTFDGSDGTFTYDGTTIEQDQDYALAIEMSGAALVTTTAYVTLEMKVQGATMPTSGLLVHMPLAEYKATDELGNTISYTNVTSSNFTEHIGIHCLDTSAAARRALVQNFTMDFNNTYTMSIWAYCTERTDWTRSMCLGNDVSHKSLTTIDPWTGTWDLCVGGYDTDTRTGFFGTTGVWYHAVQTFNNGVCKLYINGELKYTSSSLNINIDTAIVSVGAPTNQTSSMVHRGYLAGARLYNRVLTDEEISLLATEYSPKVTPTFNSQNMRFDNTTGAATKTLSFDSKGRAYSFTIIGGTLPTGVTFNGSTGMFTYDGTTIEQDQDYALTITMTGSELITTIATVTVKMRVEAEPMPTDYLFYMPMTSMSDFEATDENITVSNSSGSHPVVFTQQNGIDCACISSDYQNQGIQINNVLDSFPFGGASRTVSFWVKLVEGYISYDKTYFWYGYKDGNPGSSFTLMKYSSFGIQVVGYANTADTVTTGSAAASVISDTSWHHYAVAAYNNEDGKLQADVYLDGDLAYQAYGVAAMNTDTSRNYAMIGANHIQSLWNINPKAYYSAFRLYDRVLTSAEIQALASELTPTT